MAEPPSMVGPSASVSETTIPRKKVDFSISHYTVETTSDLSQRNMQIRNILTTPIKDRSTVIPRSTTTVVPTRDSSQQRETLRLDGGGPIHDVMSLEVKDKDIMTPDHNIYHGVYPDFQLPLPNKPHISNLFAGNTHLVSNTNSPMSMLHIPSLKKMYGTIEFAIDQTTRQVYKIGDIDVIPINLFRGIPDEDLNGQGTIEFAIDRTTGQLYKIGDIDIIPINLFRGIPDEDLNGQATDSTWLPPKIPQAMSTPISDVPGSILPMLTTQDSIPLPTPRIPTMCQEERGTSTSSSTLSNPPTTSPLFNINRANVQAASSVSSLEEGEGIVNDDEYERAICRIEKINKKITTLVRNWNEESKLAKTPTKIIEIDEFYRPYVDQYNAK